MDRTDYPPTFDWEAAKVSLKSQTQQLKHPAITIWNVGNELNLPGEVNPNPTPTPTPTPNLDPDPDPDPNPDPNLILTLSYLILSLSLTLTLRASTATRRPTRGASTKARSSWTSWGKSTRCARDETQRDLTPLRPLRPAAPCNALQRPATPRNTVAPCNRSAPPCNHPATPCNALRPQLCAVVEDEGMLCSSPLADSKLPPDWYKSLVPPEGASREAAALLRAPSQEGSNAWFRQMDGVMTNMSLNTVNHYGTAGSYYVPTDNDPEGNYFGTYEAATTRSAKPLLISEYGVDAYQSSTNAPSETCNPPPCLVMGENDASRTSQVSRPATPHDKGCNRIRAACDHMCAACNRM